MPRENRGRRSHGIVSLGKLLLFQQLLTLLFYLFGEIYRFTSVVRGKKCRLFHVFRLGTIASKSLGNLFCLGSGNPGSGKFWAVAWVNLVVLVAYRVRSALLYDVWHDTQELLLLLLIGYLSTENAVPFAWCILSLIVSVWFS